jgi:hypothetical protein|tara:strand:- start:451 stop:786 length:336 start_codon:yes stop_codon:yes gene_type:complete
MAARHKKAAGGKVREDYYAGADSNVAKEASDENESNETNDETPAEERAKAKFKPYRKGGKGRMMKGVAAKHMSAEGKMASARLDRKPRKSGGRVGADKSPLSSAHSSVSSK